MVGELSMVMGAFFRLRPAIGAAFVVVGLLLPCGGGRADTLEWALVQAYQNNPTLNAQRAAMRAQDEAVPQALSGYRPKVSLTTSVGSQYQTTPSKSITNNTPVYTRAEGVFTPPAVGI